jgi:hypothetical protein
MQNELRNQTLVAASAAKQNGFPHTYEALISIIKAMDAAGIVVSERSEQSAA